MNAFTERFAGSHGGRLLDHVLILGECHLGSLVTKYVRFYDSLSTAATDTRAGAQPSGSVRALPVLGGLHNDYREAA
jgi:hypothetical protein